MSGSCTTLFPTLNPIANSRGMSKKRREELPEGGERTCRKADGRCHPTKALKSKPWIPLMYRLVQAIKGPCQWNNFWTFWVLDFLWQLRSLGLGYVGGLFSVRLPVKGLPVSRTAMTDSRCDSRLVGDTNFASRTSMSCVILHNVAIFCL